MTALLNEYFGSISTGRITMGQMLLLAGAALLVFSVLLALVFAIFKVKYKPDKAKDAVVLPKANQPAQNGTVVLPKANQPAQNGTVVLPKREQPDRTEKGTVILPKQGGSER